MVHTKSPAYLPANILLLRGTKSWVNKRSTCFWQVASRRTWTLHSRRLIINDDAEQIVGPHIMDASSHKHWIGAAILIGVLYGVIGVVFALPSSQVRIWRLS